MPMRNTGWSSTTTTRMAVMRGTSWVSGMTGGGGDEDADGSARARVRVDASRTAPSSAARSRMVAESDPRGRRAAVEADGRRLGHRELHGGRRRRASRWRSGVRARVADGVVHGLRRDQVAWARRSGRGTPPDAGPASTVHVRPGGGEVPRELGELHAEVEDRHPRAHACAPRGPHLRTLRTEVSDEPGR